tara:strand:+ start:5936 stop:6091 length:156 start_codon:yes stop_codon:yes gene_type:complete
LAELLGCPVGELQKRMSSSEYSEWIALFNIKAVEQEEAEMKARVQARMASK